MGYLKDKLMAENMAREDKYESMPSPTNNAPSGWIGKSSSKSGKGKFSRRGFKRKRQSNGSGKKFTRKNSNTNEAKNKGQQYNSIVSGGSTGIRSNAVSGSKGSSSQGGSIGGPFGPARLLGVPKPRSGLGNGKFSFM